MIGSRVSYKDWQGMSRRQSYDKSKIKDPLENFMSELETLKNDKISNNQSSYFVKKNIAEIVLNY